jgi:hypothetical protein
MNRRKPNGPLKPDDCRALNHAWHQAAKDGYPLNALISIRPAENLTPLQYAQLVGKTWNRLGVWSRRHGGTFHAVLVRETVPCNNFHLLMHLDSNANLSLLRYAMARWFPESGQVDIRRAYQQVSYTPSGKIKSAFGYITKERTPQAAWPRWQYRRGGTVVLGKRYKITANLRVKAAGCHAEVDQDREFQERKRGKA